MELRSIWHSHCLILGFLLAPLFAPNYGCKNGDAFLAYVGEAASSFGGTRARPGLRPSRPLLRTRTMSCASARLLQGSSGHGETRQE